MDGRGRARRRRDALSRDQEGGYNGDNVAGKPRTFPIYIGGVGFYRRTCEQIVADGYRGFRFGKKVAAAAE